MAQLDSSNEDVKSELPAAHFKSLENTSDSDRTEKEIDRIIAETFMLTPGCSEAVSSVLDSVVNAGSSGSHEFEDEDPETLSMRLNLIESLQNKLKSVEKEEGEVTDEDALSGGICPEEPPKVTTSNKTHHDTSSRKRSHRSADSKSREKRRSSERRTYRTNESSKHRSTPRAYISLGKGSKPREPDRKTRASYSTRSRRSRKSEHDITKGKSETVKAGVTELSITLPVEQSSSKNSGIVVTTARDQPRLSSERVVDTSKSHTGGENRCIKRVGDSGPNLSITVNTFSDAARPANDRSHLHDSGYSSQSGSSIPRPPPRVSHRTVLGEGPDDDTDIPLPPPPLPPRTMTVSPPIRHDFVLLPPPPAPPVFPQAMEKSGTCSPSSITVQVREGGGRVAQMSSSSRTKDTGRHPEKIRSPEQPPPPPPLDRYPDNYEDVGMDVESSRSSLVSNLDHEDEANSPPRHRLISDADEEQLRQMLLNQVILHRKRLAESTTQSSDVSLFDGPGDDNTQNQSRCSNEEMPHREAPAKGEPTDISNTPAPDIRINGLSNPTKNSFRLYEPPCKRRKDNVVASEEFYSLKSPPVSTLTALEAQLKEHQSELDILDSKIMEHMTTLDTSLHRRTELRKQLAELDADIDAERVGCRLLMQRRNTIRRAVERCEELKLDLLLENEWQPSNGTETQNSDETSPIEDAHSSLHIEEPLNRSYSESVERPSEEIVAREQPEPHIEEQMRLKLLARMRKDFPASTSQDGDEEGRIPSVNEEESCNQSTQTIESEGVEETVPLYRLDSFPERLKRFVGIPPDMSVMPMDCPLEVSGEKCSDVFCQSKHSIDEELSVDDVLGMMIKYAPGLVDSMADADLTRQVDTLRARRLPDERFGLFARRLLDGLPLDKRPKTTEEVQDTNEGRHQVSA
ncbi:unnamed protein product [Cylicocyclus nassatus]|uniref:Uncharacterized protein n=1 Tax=Cylicocyclus nassatus TaxID=53992 RepID=A0AA36H836_CYLNA|nr:unnamed protein product [Cylicocyclus nassatus]